MSLRLTPTQIDVLAEIAEREHGTPPHDYARAELRAARALAVLGLLQHVDPDGDAREFALTPAGADAYDKLPADIHTRLVHLPYTPAYAALRIRQADLAKAEAEWRTATRNGVTRREIAAAECRADSRPEHWETGPDGRQHRTATWYRAVAAELHTVRDAAIAALRADVLAAHAAAVEYFDEVLDHHDVPEQADRYYEMSEAFRLAENAYTDATGLDPFVGLTVTLPETGDHEYRITDRSRYHATCELTSTTTGAKHPHWVTVSYALATTRAFARLVPTDPTRPDPATYLVERDDIGDGTYWEIVAKGPTGVDGDSPISMGIVAREIESSFREAGCTGVTYRVTVTCGDRNVTAYTPPDNPPCGCPDCKPLRRLTAVANPEEAPIDTPHDLSTWTDDELAAGERDPGRWPDPVPRPADGQAAVDDEVTRWLAAAPASVEPSKPLASSYRIHAWQHQHDVYVQVGDGPIVQTYNPIAGSFDSFAADLAYAGEEPTNADCPGTGDAVKVATWTLAGGTELLVDRGDLTVEVAAWIDPAPDGIDRDSWEATRDMLNPDQQDELLKSLDQFLDALKVRLGRDGLVVSIVDTAGAEVFRHRRVA